ncbi:MAG TPA: hypothetical protein VN260_00760, partial [Dissulfurispiraceae bacterium]|nr:hypothetical protein [Dissulfurispiraceae bacterium]
STLCVVDHWVEKLSSVRVMVSPQQGFRRIRPPFPEVYCNDKGKAPQGLADKDMIISGSLHPFPLCDSE